MAAARLVKPTGNGGCKFWRNSGMVCLASSLKAHSSTCTPRSEYSRDRGPSAFVRSWQCEQVVKMNASTTTFPRYWLSSMEGAPRRSMVSGGEGRGGATVSAANADAAHRKIRITVRIARHFQYYKFPKPRASL